MIVALLAVISTGTLVAWPSGADTATVQACCGGGFEVGAVDALTVIVVAVLPTGAEVGEMLAVAPPEQLMTSPIVPDGPVSITVNVPWLGTRVISTGDPVMVSAPYGIGVAVGLGVGVGVGVAVGVGVGVGLAVGVGVDVELAVGVALAVCKAIGLAVAVGVTVGVAVADGLGLGSAVQHTGVDDWHAARAPAAIANVHVTTRRWRFFDISYLNRNLRKRHGRRAAVYDYRRVSRSAG